MLDEALQYALDFCRDDLTEQEFVRRGNTVVDTLRTRLGELNDNSGITGFVVGGALTRMKEGEAWKKLPDTPEWWEFKNFCEERLGKSIAWAYQRMRVWKKSGKLGLKPEEVNEVGWTVADKILSMSKTPALARMLLEEFRSCGTREEFFARLSGREKEVTEGRKQRKKRRAVKFSPDQEQFYEEALSLGAEKVGKTLREDISEEEALLFIMADWRQNLTDKGTVKLTKINGRATVLLDEVEHEDGVVSQYTDEIGDGELPQ